MFSWNSTKKISWACCNDKGTSPDLEKIDVDFYLLSSFQDH